MACPGKACTPGCAVTGLAALAALADCKSHRPQSCPHQIPAEVEAAVCELRRSHPRWGPARLAFELGKRDIAPVPSEATLYRVLVRNGLIAPGQRRRPAWSYIRWERGEPMELWQLDIMGGVFLSGGTEVKLVSGLDDHSRYCVTAQLVVRATGRAVCAAFAASLARHGIPGEVLTDNGKQFTGRFTRPRPSRGAVRADLPGERHHHPADPPPHPHHDREDRTLAQDPARPNSSPPATASPAWPTPRPSWTPGSTTTTANGRTSRWA